jgi:hypothetical protein
VQVELGQAAASQLPFEHGDDLGSDPLGLGQGLPTGGEGGAGHGQAADRGQLVGERDAVVAEGAHHVRAVGGLDAGQQHVLAGGHPRSRS